MLVAEVAVCQDEARHGGSVKIVASEKVADFIFKAVAKTVEENRHTESINDFERQNPASKRLVEEVDQAFDIMVSSLLKEVEKVLLETPTDETSVEGKAHQ